MSNLSGNHEPVISEIATPASEVGMLPLELSLRGKLSVMMFLQYFTWGAWFVSLGTYLNSLHFSGERIGLVYGTSAIGAIVAPVFVGTIADRFFATQHILATLHLMGAGLLYWVSTVGEFSMFYPLMLLYFICYMPTLALTNSLAFSHMSSPEKQFPGIRVLGTIGWIVAGILVGYLEWEQQNSAMQLGAAASAVLAIYCLALPHTPPANPKGRISLGTILGLDALGLMKQWSFAVFVAGSFLICIPLQFYYGFTNQFLNDIGVTNAVGKMTIGQMSEILFMLVMPLFFVRLGVKYMLLVGMAAWATRYVLFGFGNPTDRMWMLYIGIALHGVCYDFFFVTGYIYVDKKANESIRASAQGFLTLVTWGIGGFIGTWLAGITSDYFTTGSQHDWLRFWLVPAVAAGVVTALFAVMFRDRIDIPQDASTGV
ncbi:MAG TPA: nucleoside permease [Pirellulales bacterium]|jgi:nucleoside transporter|nr:nucleoside permease [Pirellulales bacterium]